MKSENNCSFIGRLGADPEVTNLRNSDGVVVNMRIAVDNTYKDRDGREAGKAEWVPIVLFGHAAEIADKYLRKGQNVFVRGAFRTREWEDRDGNKRYTSEIVVDNFTGHIQLIDSRDRDSGGGGRDSRRDEGGSRDDRRRNDDRDRGGRNDDRRGRDDDRSRRDDRDRDRRDDSRRGNDDRDRRDGGGNRDQDRRADDRRREMDDDIPF